MINRILKAFHKPIHYKDGYIELLRRVNAGMMHHGNIACFEYAIRNLPSDSPIIEIGAFCGLSANVITYLKNVHQKTNILVSTDTFQWPVRKKTGKISNSGLTYEDLQAYVRKSLIYNISLFSADDMPYIFEKDSDSFFRSWENKETEIDIFGKSLELGSKISFAYIDGNHTYEFVHRDYENCDSLLEIGGYLFFDDSADYSDWEVKKVIKEIKKTNRYQVIMKNPNYLFKKIK